MKYEFSENNSGGHWWLKRKHYEALFAAGWTYTPDEYDIKQGYDKEPFSGNDDVPYGWRHGLKGDFPNIRAAIESWEAATRQDFFAEGCNCCGAPFSISGGNGNDEYMSGNSVDHKAVRPW